MQPKGLYCFGHLGAVCRNGFHETIVNTEFKKWRRGKKTVSTESTLIALQNHHLANYILPYEVMKGNNNET